MRIIHRTIVTALIYSQDNKLLMGKKDPHKSSVYLDCWHLPGGGVEANESQTEAIIREVKEEVGLDLSAYKIEFMTDKDHGSAQKTLESGEKVLVKMQFNVYQIKVTDKTSSELELILTDAEFIETRWFSIPELSQVKLTPPSERYFKEIGYLKT